MFYVHFSLVYVLFSDFVPQKKEKSAKSNASSFKRTLSQIALLVRNKVARLLVQMGSVRCMAAFSTTLVALILSTGGNIAIAEVEDGIFIHRVPPFRKYRNIGIGMIQE